MFVHPSTLTKTSFSWLLIRDASLFTAYLTLSLIYGLASICPSKPAVRIIIIANLFLAAVRILKNSGQFAANRNEQPWTRFFKEDHYICGLRLYTFVDAFSYALWIFGAVTVTTSPSTDTTCSDGILTLLIQYEVVASCITYIGFLLLTIMQSSCHKYSKGRVFPGFRLVNEAWPDQCPSIRYDTGLWRSRGETLPLYRSRVVEEYVRSTTTISRQPLPIEMTVTEYGMNELEIQALKEFTFTSNPALKELEFNPGSQETLIEMSTDTTCALCICEYEEGDLIRELTCRHRFHSHCVDKWLLSKSICPVCNHDCKLPLIVAIS